MSGKAMLTIVVSRKARKAPAQAMNDAGSMTAVIHRRGDYTMSVGIEAKEKPKAAGDDARDGRDRLLRGARQLLAEKGYAGMELRDVAARGKAPRGSIYHHFPGGKRQLAVEATALEGTQIRDTIERALAELGVKRTLQMFGTVFSRRAADHPERIGCPVAAAALARPEDPALAAAATAAFQSWEEPIAAALEPKGSSPSAPRPSPASSSRRSRAP